jgi:hypothetical protein
MRQWNSVNVHIPDALQRCQGFLINSPEDRIKSGGKLKKLKGKFTGLLQFDITD